MMYYKKVDRKIWLLMAVVAAASLWYLSRPWIFLIGEEGILDMALAYGGMPVNIRFIHSVQKTPVEEYLVVSDDLSGLVLQSTRYHSFGVGLPFMESDGSFRQEGDDFVMDDMNRHFPFLSLRTGVGTMLTVTVDGEAHHLYRFYPPGYRVDIAVAPAFYGLKVLLQKNFARR